LEEKKNNSKTKNEKLKTYENKIIFSSMWIGYST